MDTDAGTGKRLDRTLEPGQEAAEAAELGTGKPRLAALRWMMATTCSR